MTSDLSGARDGISERFAPEQDPGRLIEVEHLSRYRWAARAAAGRSVLDAGCGTAYGSRLLAEGGARSVTGVDIAGSVLEAVAPEMPETVTLRRGDLRALVDNDDTYELVVCFEVIEHFADPFPVLDELTRVLAPGGVLLVSSPNRGVYQEGNPHHLHEFTPEELHAALSERLGHVMLMRQSNYIASALLSEDQFAAGDFARLDDRVAVHKLIAARPGEETYTVAVAGDQAPPELGSLALLTGTLEMREWLSVFETQTRAISDKDGHIEALESRVREADRLQSLLLEAEQRSARLPELELRIAELEDALAEAHRGAEAARAEARGLDERLMQAEQVLVNVMNSPSWRVTEPLRQAKKLLR
jgi:SAM-dependent methyltransferase